LFYRYKGYWYPTAKLVETAHQNALGNYGGIFGLRDAGGLDSAACAPLASAGGEDAFLYKVAAVGFRLVKNHPFQDANRRTAWMTVGGTLHQNGYHPSRPAIGCEDGMVLLAARHLDIAAFRAFLLIACNQDYTDERL